MAYTFIEGIVQEYSCHWFGNGDQTIPEPINLFPMGNEFAVSEILPNFYGIFELNIYMENKKRQPLSHCLQVQCGSVSYTAIYEKHWHSRKLWHSQFLRCGLSVFHLFRNDHFRRSEKAPLHLQIVKIDSILFVHGHRQGCLEYGNCETKVEKK